MEEETDEAGPRKLIGRASIVAAGSLYQQGISLVSGLIVARVIGAADYGIFNLARSLVDVTGILTRLGLDVGLQRYFGETNTERHRASRIAVLWRLRLLAGSFALLPVVAVALGLGRVLEANVYPYSRFAEVLLCLALALPFATDIAVLGGAYRGMLKLAPSVIAECVLLPTIRLAAILILFMAGWRLWAVVVGTMLGSFLASAFLAMRARSDFRGDGFAQPQSWLDAVKVLRYSSILAMTVLVVALTSSVDLLLLGRFATAEDLGQYSLVKMLLTLMVVFGMAFGSGVPALIAQRYFCGDRGGMLRVMALTARWTTLATAPMFVIFLFWGAQLTLLFGPSFAASQAVVGWLAAGQFVATISWPSAGALSMTGKHFLELKVLSAGLVIVTLLCWVAVPTFGQLGAAVATCTSVAIVNVARVLFVRRSLGAFPFGRDIFIITAVGIGLAWASSVMVAQFSLNSFWSAVSGIGCFLMAYAIAVWTHLLSESEKSAICGTLIGTARILRTSFGRAR